MRPLESLSSARIGLQLPGKISNLPFPMSIFKIEGTAGFNKKKWSKLGSTTHKPNKRVGVQIHIMGYGIDTP